MRRFRPLMMVGLVLGALALAASPASAHSSILSGQTACNNGTHVITWSVGNDFNLQMTIDTATATVNNQSYAVVGYTNPVAGLGTTSATTAIPGDVTGVVTLTVHSVWSDEFSQTNTTTVDLTVPCNEDTTTTTTTVNTTTTAAEATTTTPSTEVATTTVPGDSTTTPTTPTTTSISVHETTGYICTIPPITAVGTPVCTSLPHTGSNSSGLLWVGIGLVGAGFFTTLIAGKRRRLA